MDHDVPDQQRNLIKIMWRYEKRAGAYQPVAQQSADHGGAECSRGLGNSNSLGVCHARKGPGLEQEGLVHQPHNEQGARQVAKEAEEPVLQQLQPGGLALQ